MPREKVSRRGGNNKRAKGKGETGGQVKRGIDKDRQKSREREREAETQRRERERETEEYTDRQTEKRDR